MSNSDSTLTGNIKIENIMFISGIIDQLPARFVHDQHFPLRDSSIPSSMGVRNTHFVASCIADRIENDYFMLSVIRRV